MSTTINPEDLRELPLRSLAGLIHQDWQKPYFGAVPYIQAMYALQSIDDAYGLDDGHGIVCYFLANARTWRGPTAKAVKAELKRRCRWA